MKTNNVGFVTAINNDLVQGFGPGILLIIPMAILCLFAKNDHNHGELHPKEMNWGLAK